VAVLVDEVGAGDEDDGFMVGDDGGGFVDDDDGGGFIEGDASPPLEKEDELGPAASTRIALSDLPRILASLGLPNDDDVLGVFRASASGWDEDEQSARQRKRADEAELGVEKKDFRAVCAALMGPDSGGDEGSGSDNEEEDAYQLPLDESSLSSLSELDYDGGPPKVKRAGSPKTRAKRSRKALEVDSERAKLNSRQKEVVRDIWAMLKPKIKDGGGGRGSNILGREEVKHWVRTLGEMWTEEEVSLLLYT